MHWYTLSQTVCSQCTGTHSYSYPNHSTIIKDDVSSEFKVDTGTSGQAKGMRRVCPGILVHYDRSVRKTSRLAGGQAREEDVASVYGYTGTI